MVWPLIIAAAASVASAALAPKPGAPVPTSADALFGPGMMNNDSSGWQINFGDGASSVLDNGNRGAPNQTPVNTVAPGGYLPQTVAPGNTAAAVAGSLASLPWLYIIGGAALLIVVWKKA